MTKKNIVKILERLEYWEQEDNRWQRAVDNFTKEIAPGSYSPIVEGCCTDSFIEGVSILHPELKEELEYFICEASIIDGCEVQFKDKKYNAKDVKEYADYIFDCYYKEKT